MGAVSLKADHGIAKRDDAALQHTTDRTGSSPQRRTCTVSDLIIEQTAGCGDTNHFELDLADAEQGARLSGHHSGRHRDVASREGRIDRSAKYVGGFEKLRAALNGHVSMASIFVPIADDPATAAHGYLVDRSHG